MEGEKCLDCKGKTDNLSEVREDFYVHQKKQIAFNNKVIGGLAVFSAVIGIFATITFLTYRSIVSDVHASQADNKKISTDVAVIKNDIQNIKSHLSKLDKNGEDTRKTLQLILQKLN
jgi:cell division protein FtsB